MENRIIYIGDKKSYSRKELTETVILIFKYRMVPEEDHEKFVLTEDSVISEVFPDMDYADKTNVIMETEGDYSVRYIREIIDEKDLNDEINYFKFDFKTKSIKDYVNTLIKKLKYEGRRLDYKVEITE